MDKYHLERFVSAQEQSYKDALHEIQTGRKRTHWMWYIFPQIKGLGFSEMAKYYEIQSFEEAEAYLNHPVLGTRLIEISNALLTLECNDARIVMGTPDDLKLRSSMTLFSIVDSKYDVFQKVLDKYYKGKKDGRTISILEKMH